MLSEQTLTSDGLTWVGSEITGHCMVVIRNFNFNLSTNGLLSQSNFSHLSTAQPRTSEAKQLIYRQRDRKPSDDLGIHFFFYSDPRVINYQIS